MATSRPGQCALFAVLAAASLLSGSSRALAQQNTFILAAAPGYGVEDCLAEGGECGHVVADAWCEAHGQHAAIDFGRSAAKRLEDAPYFITCGD